MTTESAFAMSVLKTSPLTTKLVKSTAETSSY
jgi:hypothetical protein